MNKAFFLLIFVSVVAMSEAKGPEENLLSDLARVVNKADKNPIPEESEASLVDLVGIIAGSGEESARHAGSSVHSDVLKYITDAYSSSGFYDSGFKGNLPEYFLQGNNTNYLPGQDVFLNTGLGRITSGFGYRAKFGRMHKGVDIAMNVGDTVRAAMSGVVERVDYEANGYGRFVVLSHDDGMETRYAHLSAPLVVCGQRVSSGQAIALSGNSGNSTGPHLHFETRCQGRAVDPLSVFGIPSRNAFKEQRRTYVVRHGDTIRKIAQKSGIGVIRLCQLNFVTEDESLEPGRMLRLR